MKHVYEIEFTNMRDQPIVQHIVAGGIIAAAIAAAQVAANEGAVLVRVQRKMEIMIIEDGEIEE